MRFEGFGGDEDEWVNVKKCIRERSIPLESSQCRSIVEGDLVLCFRVSGLLEKKETISLEYRSIIKPGTVIALDCVLCRASFYFPLKSFR